MQLDIRLYQPKPKTSRLLNELYDKSQELETTRKIVSEYQSEILRVNYWTNEAEVEQYAGVQIALDKEVITDPDNTFLLSEANLAKYRELCYKEAKKRGFKVTPFQICPVTLGEKEVEVLKLKLSFRVVKELEDQKITSLYSIRRLDPKTYHRQMEYIITDLLAEVKKRRSLSERRRAEVSNDRNKERRAL